jgi:hypothetical protein
MTGLMIDFSICGYSEIVYTELDVNDQILGFGGLLDIDFTGDGVAEFTFFDDGLTSIQPSVFFQFQGDHLATMGPLGAGHDELQGIAAGDPIDEHSSWFDEGDAYIDPFWGIFNFPQDQEVYLSATFTDNSLTHYGWIRVVWSPAILEFKVLGYAFEDTPDMAINAGQEASVVSSVFASIQDSNEYEVYPNPTSALTRINVSSEQSWELVNIQGESVMSGTGEVIDMTGLISGVYFVHVDGTVNKVIKE